MNISCVWKKYTGKLLIFSKYDSNVVTILEIRLLLVEKTLSHRDGNLEMKS